MDLLTMNSLPRRQFLQTTAAATSTAFFAPNILRANSNNSAETVIGQGEHTYKVVHQWAQLPDKYTWQTTHNVAVDKANNLYVIHEGHENKKDHPSIFVFDPNGKFIRAFGSQFQGGGHGIEVREEGGTEFLYVAAYQKVKAIAKMTLTGEVVWQQRAPKESKKYEGETYDDAKVWPKGSPRDLFLPTNFAFLDDGGFLLADGYGAFLIQRYDKDGKWVSCFGGEGPGQGTFNTAHGLWVDKRDPNHPMIVVTDRAHDTLQRFTMDGKYIDTLTGFGLPANIDTRGKLMLVPELKARLSILGPDNQVVAHLGADVERITADGGIRNDEKKWLDGKFVHPHDACFDNDGNIFVAEWVATGRITKLIKV
jgi:hypothetical protein